MSFPSKGAIYALQLFAMARSIKQYEQAKRFAAKLDAVEQLALVDSIIIAKRRVYAAVAA